MFYINLIFVICLCLFSIKAKNIQIGEHNIEYFSYNKNIYSSNLKSDYFLLNTTFGVNVLDKLFVVGLNLNNIYASNFYLFLNNYKGFKRLYANYFLYLNKQTESSYLRLGFLEDINSDIGLNIYTPENNFFYSFTLPLLTKNNEINYYLINNQNNSKPLQLQYNKKFLENKFDFKISYTPSSYISLNNYYNNKEHNKIGAILDFYDEKKGLGYGSMAEVFNNINTNNYYIGLSSRVDYLGFSLVISDKNGFNNSEIPIKYNIFSTSFYYSFAKYNVGLYYSLSSNNFYNKQSISHLFNYVVGYNINKRYFIKLAFMQQNVFTNNKSYYNKGISIGFGDYLF
jgi:hypothetical protein